jgi:hypothetical protein
VLAGIVARGGARSRRLARKLGVPLVLDAGEAPAADVACVAVGSPAVATELSRSFLRRGVHVGGADFAVDCERETTARDDGTGYTVGQQIVAGSTPASSPCSTSPGRSRGPRRAPGRASERGRGDWRAAEGG